MKRILQKIKCLFGFHDWEDVTHPTHGFKYTYRCRYCHKFKRRDWWGDGW